MTYCGKSSSPDSRGEQERESSLVRAKLVPKKKTHNIFKVCLGYAWCVHVAQVAHVVQSTQEATDVSLKKGEKREAGFSLLAWSLACLLTPKCNSLNTQCVPALLQGCGECDSREQ